MNCACCGEVLARGADLPENRRWLRPGDRACIPCEWTFPRELLYEEALRVTRCPQHSQREGVGPEGAARPTP